jgi:peptidoglycan/LPS O-acetylase OafA/YrhL
VIWFSFIKLKSFPVGVQWSALVLLMVAIPVAAYRFLEQPGIEIGRRLAARWSAGRARREASRKGIFQESPQLAD